MLLPETQIADKEKKLRQNILGEVTIVKKKRNKGSFQDPAIQTDPSGSYTGRPENIYEQPVQDADDL